MRYEDWVQHEREAERERAARFGPRPTADGEKIAELRAELDGLAGRLKAELLAELRAEVERLIAMQARSVEPSQMEEHYASR
ncbi:MAG: hypothetical protein WEA61_10620 [Anaerolineales bacterium]